MAILKLWWYRNR